MSRFNYRDYFISNALRAWYAVSPEFGVCMSVCVCAHAAGRGWKSFESGQQTEVLV